MKQQKLISESSKHRFSHGGKLRKKRRGRGVRPLSCQESLHVVFKVDKSRLRKKSLRHPFSYQLIQKILRLYAKRFFVKIEQCSVQNDHIHLLIRTGRRSHFHYFFRVVSGQIAQRFQKEGLLLLEEVSGIKAKIPVKAVGSSQEAETLGGIGHGLGLSAKSESVTGTPDKAQSRQRAESELLGVTHTPKVPKTQQTGEKLWQVTDTPKGGLQTEHRSPMTAPPVIEAEASSRSSETSTNQSLPSKPAKGTKLWLARPFSRVVRSWKALKIIRAYIRLNELEAQGKIPYRAQRLRAWGELTRVLNLI